MRNDRTAHPGRAAPPRSPHPRTTAHEPPRIVERRVLERIMAQRCAGLPPRGVRKMSLGEELFVRLSIGNQG